MIPQGYSRSKSSLNYCVKLSLYLYTFSYYYAMVRDPRGELVEASVHLLCIILDYIPPSDFTRRLQQQQIPPTNPAQRATSSIMQEPGMGNLFCSFLSRLHQNEVRISNQYNIWVFPSLCSSLLYPFLCLIS